MNRLRLLLIPLFLMGLLCRAENSTDSISNPLRPLSSFYALEIGSSKTLSTYLSPIRYSGTHIGLKGNWSRAMAFNPEKFIMSFDAAASLDLTHNPAQTSSMSGIDFSLGWSMLYRVRPLKDFQLGVGAGIEFDAGALYLARNSNNPVAARVSLDLTLNLRADYSLRIGKFPITFSDKLSLPSLGVFFSPEYGESYYEIYLGEHSGLAHCGWWGNHFAITNTLMAMIPICNIRLCIGYEIQCRSSYVNYINTRIVNNSFMLGISTDWINVTRNSDFAGRKVIPVYY